MPEVGTAKVPIFLLAAAASSVAFLPCIRWPSKLISLTNCRGSRLEKPLDLSSNRVRRRGKTVQLALVERRRAHFLCALGTRHLHQDQFTPRLGLLHLLARQFGEGGSAPEGWVKVRAYLIYRRQASSGNCCIKSGRGGNGQ
ncbi:hypothetical protein GALL_477920 [mine drainage metagenome]|uniref:Uncharacterized protein n=1 Tax=mine drainage metagenome TaxID=410659 RepID=A0A1J5PZ92_9ZZZZ